MTDKKTLYQQIDERLERLRQWGVPTPKVTTIPAARPANRRLYFAYGSNLHRPQMKSRCPGSSALYPHNLPGFKLEFQRHANVVEAGENDSVPGAIYLIDPQDEADLDAFEGVAKGSYERKTFKFLTPKGNWRDVLYYQKKPGRLIPPSTDYLRRIVEGYKAFGLDLSKLNPAIEAANKADRELEAKSQPLPEEGDIWFAAEDRVIARLSDEAFDAMSQEEFDRKVQQEVQKMLKEE